MSFNEITEIIRLAMTGNVPCSFSFYPAHRLYIIVYTGEHSNTTFDFDTSVELDQETFADLKAMVTK